VKFVKPTAETLEACRRDLIEAGVVENRDQKSERKTFRDPAKTAVENQSPKSGLPFFCTEHKFRTDGAGIRRCHVCDFTVYPSEMV
jgi:hypothetical protein